MGTLLAVRPVWRSPWISVQERGLALPLVRTALPHRRSREAPCSGRTLFPCITSPITAPNDQPNVACLRRGLVTWRAGQDIHPLRPLFHILILISALRSACVPDAHTTQPLPPAVAPVLARTARTRVREKNYAGRLASPARTPSCASAHALSHGQAQRPLCRSARRTSSCAILGTCC